MQQVFVVGPRSVSKSTIGSLGRGDRLYGSVNVQGGLNDDADLSLTCGVGGLSFGKVSSVQIDYTAPVDCVAELVAGNRFSVVSSKKIAYQMQIEKTVINAVKSNATTLSTSSFPDLLLIVGVFVLGIAVTRLFK